MDWSKQIIEDASIDDLDSRAIEEAKKGFKQRYPQMAPEVDKWDLPIFLDKAKLTIDGKVTRAAILLIGKEESAHFLNHIAQIDWKLSTKEERAAEVWKYDEKTILEGLHNCIAHQRYQSNSRIVVTERSDSLEFWNAGDFYEGKYEDYIEGTKTPKKYRNPFLTQAMLNIKMIDTQGYGIGWTESNKARADAFEKSRHRLCSLQH